MKFANVKVRLFGESFKIHVLNIDNNNVEIFYKISRILKQPIEEALLNIHFFEKLNNKSIQSTEDLICHTYGGLLNTTKNKIEIWQARRCVQKLNMNDLFHPNTLFPLYSVRKHHSVLKLNNRIFLIEKEVGLIAEFLIDQERIDIDKLVFSVSEITYGLDNYQILDELHYDNLKLTKNKSDTLITHNHCINNLN